jgi:hypothetical protein
LLLLIEEKITEKAITAFYHQRKPLDKALAEFVAKNGFTFRQVVKSELLPSGLLAVGYSNIPKSTTNVKDCVQDFYIKCKKRSCGRNACLQSPQIFDHFL